MSRRSTPPFLLPLALFALGCAHGSPPGGTIALSEGERGIVVTGEGEAEAPPDRARFDVGVEVRRPTVAEAREEAARVQGRVIEALRGAGVTDEDVQTSQLSIRPEYEHTQTGRNLLGYTARNTVEVRVTDLERLSRTVDAAVRAGGDAVRLRGIRFELSDPSALRAEARREAMDEARATAEQLARLAGVELGPPLAIEETGAPTGGPRPMMMEARTAEQAPETPIEPGVSRVRVQLRARWAIR
jgi:hypothetical protein